MSNQTPADLARSLTEAEAAMLGLDRVDGIADGQRTFRNPEHRAELAKERT